MKTIIKDNSSTGSYLFFRDLSLGTIFKITTDDELRLKISGTSYIMLYEANTWAVATYNKATTWHDMKVIPYETTVTIELHNIDMNQCR